MTNAPQFDMYGRLIPSSTIDPDIFKGMSSPVRCTHCGQVYDMSIVTITTRFVDCSRWTSPCCKRTVDDRGPSWKPNPDFERL